MRAILCEQYGPPEVLHAADLPDPLPGPQEVRVQVHATTVNYGDRLARNFSALKASEFNMPWPLFLVSKLLFGARKPKVRVLGSEFSGIVDQVGSAVTRFRPGDAVFGYKGMDMGAYAELLCIKETGCLTAKPEGLTHVQAASLPYGAVIAWHILHKGGLRAGQRLLVIGASGSMGAAAVQIGQYLGAEVDGVCGPDGIDYVRSLGAQRVYNYREEDFSRGDAAWDRVFDILGRTPWEACRRVLPADGRALSASFKSGKLLRMLATRLGSGPKLDCILAPGSRQDLEAVSVPIREGAFRSRPHAVFPLEEAAAAHREAEAAGNRGPIVLQVREEPSHA